LPADEFWLYHIVTVLEHFRGDWNRKGLPKRVASVILGLR
jgi:hypothetical protein